MILIDKEAVIAEFNKHIAAMRKEGDHTYALFTTGLRLVIEEQPEVKLPVQSKFPYLITERCICGAQMQLDIEEVGHGLQYVVCCSKNHLHNGRIIGTPAHD